VAPTRSVYGDLCLRHLLEDLVIQKLILTLRVETLTKAIFPRLLGMMVAVLALHRREPVT
jgi:hypothetical protein